MQHHSEAKRILASAPAASVASSLPAPPAASPLWPLSPYFPPAAAELVRSKLPSLTLASLRLVSRAACYEFVDGRAVRVRRLFDAADVAALVTAAPRLRRLESLSTSALSVESRLSAANCEALAEVLARLPNGGAALRELRLCAITVGGSGALLFAGLVAAGYGGRESCLHRLAAAIGRLPGLETLEVELGSLWDDGASALVRAAAAAPALKRLRLRPLLGVQPPAELRAWLLAGPLPQRLEALEVRSGAAQLLLPAVLRPQVALRLARLRDLSIDLGGDPWAPSSSPLDPAAAAPWRAPWLAQLTRLSIAGGNRHLLAAARALAPGALPALRALEARPFDHRLGAAALRGLLGACDAAALRSLTLHSPIIEEVRGLVAALPALEALELIDPDTASAAWKRPRRRRQHGGGGDVGAADQGGAAAGGGGGGDQGDAAGGGEDGYCEPRACLRAEYGSWLPLVKELRAPLARLKLHLSGPIEHYDPFGLAPLAAGSACAASLRELDLSLIGDDGGLDAGGRQGRDELRSLRALGALPRLRKLSLEVWGFDQAVLEEAAAEGWAKGWAPRLADFELRVSPEEVPDAAALLRALVRGLGFAALERLALDTRTYFDPSNLDAFGRAAAAALPRLAALEFSAQALQPAACGGGGGGGGGDWSGSAEDWSSGDEYEEEEEYEEECEA